MNEFPLSCSIEAVSDKGEDALLFVNGKVVTIGVFDGLGGKPAGFGGERGGRIASRETSVITEAILRENARELSEEDAFHIQQKVCKHLKQEADTKIQSRIKGSLAHRLCTTLAIVSIIIPDTPEELLQLNLAWIGDSRIYFLSPEKGLQQLTKDDLKVPNDAFKLIHEDSPMSQFLTADMSDDWRINFKVQKFAGKGCVLACTDGCFQCLDSPWTFEKLLLDTMSESNSVIDWRNLLTQRYEKIKQDDVSLVLYPVGFDADDFKSLKSSYQLRLDKLNDSLNLVSSNYDDLLNFWHEYRLYYEEMLAFYESSKTEEILNLINHQNENFSDNCQELQNFDDIDTSIVNDGNIREEDSLLEQNQLDNSQAILKASQINSQAYCSDNESAFFSLQNDITLSSANGNNSTVQMDKTPVRCPECESDDITKNGSTSSKEQKYKCKSCNRQFQESTKSQYSKIQINVNSSI